MDAQSCVVTRHPLKSYLKVQKPPLASLPSPQEHTMEMAQSVEMACKNATKILINLGVTGWSISIQYRASPNGLLNHEPQGMRRFCELRPARLSP